MQLSGPDDDMELSGPDGGGWYTSQMADWVPLCPQLKDSAVRLYWIMRSLVIEKRGPVRKLTLMELCHLLPTASGAASSLARVRGLLSDLSEVGLISTPTDGTRCGGKRVKTSSRAKASGTALRIQMNTRPRDPGYSGPRNAFAALDSIRETASERAAAAVRKEAAREAARRLERAGHDASNAGQISGPLSSTLETGQISSPPGQKSSPRGQISGPDSGADLRVRQPPFSPPVQSFRPDQPSRPSVPTPEVGARGRASTDGRTDGGGSAVVQDEMRGGRGESAAAGAAPAKSAATGAGSGRRSPVPAAGEPIMGPGADVLRAVMAELPEWTLDAAALRDQALTVDGLLASGFTPAEIRNVFASRPLPAPLTHTVGAVAARRLRDLMQIGPLAEVPHIPGQDGGQEHAGRHHNDPTPTPAPLAERMAGIEAAARGGGPARYCPERGGTCPNMAAPGEERCPEHLGWPMCAVCGDRKFGARRMRPGAQACDRCTPRAEWPVSDAALAGLLAEAAQRAQEADYYDSGRFERDAAPGGAPF